MIDKKELRIGNFVLIDGSVIQLKTFIELYNIFDQMKGAQGVPLTEERLLKFGFEKIKGAHASWKTKKVNDEWEFNIQFFVVSGECRYGRAVFKSVHQLQNLYFALTGEELTVTP